MKALSIIRAVAVAALMICAGCASNEGHVSKVRPEGEACPPRGVALNYDATTGQWGYAETDPVTRHFDSVTGQWDYWPPAEAKDYTPIPPARDRDLDKAEKRPLDEGLKSAP